MVSSVALAPENQPAAVAEVPAVAVLVPALRKVVLFPPPSAVLAAVAAGTDFGLMYLCHSRQPKQPPLLLP